MSQSTIKKSRNTIINPKFVTGYAENWVFPIPDVFQDALDIRMTQRTDRATSQTTKVLTQGDNYAFKTGYTFYNSKMGYENWHEFLNGKNPIAVQINDFDSFGELNQENSLNSKELVKIIIYRPNKDKSSLVKAEEHTLTANQLFNFLQMGTIFQSEYAYEK